MFAGCINKNYERETSRVIDSGECRFLTLIIFINYRTHKWNASLSASHHWMSKRNSYLSARRLDSFVVPFLGMDGQWTENMRLKKLEMLSIIQSESSSRTRTAEKKNRGKHLRLWLKFICLCNCKGYSIVSPSTLNSQGEREGIVSHITIEWSDHDVFIVMWMGISFTIFLLCSKSKIFFPVWVHIKNIKLHSRFSPILLLRFAPHGVWFIGYIFL